MSLPLSIGPLSAWLPSRCVLEPILDTMLDGAADEFPNLAE
jgi:hypothetical protein